MAETVLLEIDRLSFAYRPDQLILRDFSMKVSSGDFVGLIGANGAGKTTMFQLLSHYLRPQAGAIRLDGKPLEAYSDRERSQRMAVVPQAFYTPLPLTVHQLISLGRTPQIGLTSRGNTPDSRQEIRQLAEALELGEFLDRPMTELSGGERQRAILAAALAQRPQLLLLDEPTSALDLGHTVALMDLICRLQEQYQLTILMITHDLELAGRYCRRLLLLKNGRLLKDGTPEEVITPELIQQAYNCPVDVVSGRHRDLLISY